MNQSGRQPTAEQNSARLTPSYETHGDGRERNGDDDLKNTNETSRPAVRTYEA